ncbi:MAG: hypothetical protein D6820_14215 [Lentisphaerae bacterium]|nr:MAG: hypothetical protein D6820_14215 [Lentisphaerota bacterium]
MARKKYGVLTMAAMAMMFFLTQSGYLIAGETVEVKLAGTIIKKTKRNGKPKWFLKLEDGRNFKMRTPRPSAGFTFDNYIGKKVVLTFRATVTTDENGKRKLRFVKTYPIAIHVPEEGEALPPIDPDLDLSADN